MNDERLPETAVKRVLDRASAIELAQASSVPVDALRQAARDAGISPAAFEAALAEERRGALSVKSTPRRPWRRVSAVLAAVMVIGVFIIPVIFPPTLVETVAVPLVSETLTLRCLDGAAASELARGQMNLRENELQYNANEPHLLHVKATADQITRVKSAIDAAEAQAPSCSVTNKN